MKTRRGVAGALALTIWCSAGSGHPPKPVSSRACQAGTVPAPTTAGATRITPGPRVRPTPEAPRRIVSVVPAATEMLFAIGAADRLVGVSSFDRFPLQVDRLPRVGGLLDPDVERILALKPDLAIVYSTQTELRLQLERAAIPLFVYVHRDLADILTTIRALGARTGLEAEADAESRRIEAQFEAVRRRVAGRPRPKTLLVFGREPGSLRGIVSSGGYGFLHDMLEIAGGADVLGDIRRESVQMSAEMVLARAPEVIVELHYGAELQAAQLESERRVWSRLAAVPAVKHGRVYLLAGNAFVVPGPRVGDAAAKIADVLHPNTR